MGTKIDKKAVVNRLSYSVENFSGAQTATSHLKARKKKITSLLVKILKGIIYAFFLSIGLYGCFQNMANHWTVQSLVVGNGLELGFNADPASASGDIRFDLIYNGSGPFYAYSDFTWAYGPFYALFVWPIGQILLHFLYATRDWPVGLNVILGLIIVLFIIRLITVAITARATFQSEKMSEIQGKIAEINAKYKDAKDMQSRQKKQLETRELYRKHGIKPLAPFESMIITLPIFLIIYRVVTILRYLKFISLFGIWDLTQTPISQLFSNFTNGGWHYLFFLLLVIPVQIISQKTPQWLAKKRGRGATTVGAKNQQQLKRSRMTQNIIMIVLAVVVAISSSGVGLYWFFNAIFTIVQSVIIHKIIMKRRTMSTTRIDSKLAKLGIS
ncbi:membrane protein insertase YidC [Ureaplasma miroungigenitalium]|uniref:Membrane protein insertase YidC n=1 Tax=Ureaplasma miroungigenitalium TaxID=1042321 RepID=A0ABT3BNB0_9BACT|nr:membrane protein insertase YidC [Ureaplasma miroungigenitalium]MCV3728723.1 membrane protein insertase YidC [Ureaplasma miroungigenitalium]MCV3734487.1 membrane protein insertase YidC [Ureaplasma miroungigenitalium]